MLSGATAAAATQQMLAALASRLDQGWAPRVGALALLPGCTPGVCGRLSRSRPCGRQLPLRSSQSS